MHKVLIGPITNLVYFVKLFRTLHSLRRQGFTALLTVLHGSDGEGGGGHHAATRLYIVEPRHEGGQLVGGQLLLLLQVHPHPLSNVPAHTTQ